MNNPYNNGDVYNARDVNMLLTRNVWARQQLLGRVLTGYACQTTTNATQLEKQDVQFDYKADGAGAVGTGNGYTSKTWSFDGAVYTNLGQTSATLITEFFPDASTISYGSMVWDYAVYDTFDVWDSSVDTAKWTTSGTVTESGTQLTVSTTAGGTSYALTNGSGAVNLNSYKVITFHLDVTGTVSGNSGSTVNLYLNDGSSDTLIQTLLLINGNGAYSFGTLSQTYLVTLYNDGTNGRVLVYIDDRYVTTYTYASGTLRVKFYGTSSGSGTATSSCKVNFIGTSKASPTSTIAWTITADGGSNWESYEQNAPHTFSNTGNLLGVKATCTVSATEFILFKTYAIQKDF